MESLFGSLPEMLDFQKVFLETLEDGISSSSDFNTLETPSQFRVNILSILCSVPANVCENLAVRTL